MVLIAITIVKGLLCAWFFTCLVLFNPTKMMKVGLKILFLFSETQERKCLTQRYLAKGWRYAFSPDLLNLKAWLSSTCWPQFL